MSSAYKSNSYLTACGMSFIYKRNRSEPQIDPWGTPHKSYPGSEKYLFKLTLNFLCDSYDLNRKMTSITPFCDIFQPALVKIWPRREKVVLLIRVGS